MISDAIDLHNHSALGEELRATTLRAIDTEVEHWYQESQIEETHSEEKLLSIPANGQNDHPQTVATTDTPQHAQAMRMEKKLARRQELLKASLNSQVRKLREHFERREYVV